MIILYLRYRLIEVVRHSETLGELVLYEALYENDEELSVTTSTYNINGLA
ncbi:MAG: DUF1653 domain-containing protein [Bdellovibrionaceae bacterium]|nr:DUF1653 domain-containing protein [Pseudobdellovibrionaceae bacterium]